MVPAEILTEHARFDAGPGEPRLGTAARGYNVAVEIRVGRGDLNPRLDHRFAAVFTVAPHSAHGPRGSPCGPLLDAVMGSSPRFRPGRRDACKGLLSLGFSLGACESGDTKTPAETGSGSGGAVTPLEVEPLPPPVLDGTVSVEAALAGRRSRRTYTAVPLTREEIGQLLWAAQGITDPSSKRTAPSAGALYPLELYLLAPDGIHHYLPPGHELALMAREDVRGQVPAQSFVSEGPTIFVVTAVFARTLERYGDSAGRFVHLEAGHAAHGLVLQAQAMGLGGTTVGSFGKEELMRLMNLPTDHEPIYVIPVGHPA